MRQNKTNRPRIKNVQESGADGAKTRTWSPATWQLLLAESASEWQRMANG